MRQNCEEFTLNRCAIAMTHFVTECVMKHDLCSLHVLATHGKRNVIQVADFNALACTGGGKRFDDERKRQFRGMISYAARV